jgi:micrococcal nuclease
VRLQGVDCPEGGQAFGAAAKRFTSELVFGKDVKVNPRDTDRRGRTTGDITVEGRDVALPSPKLERLALHPLLAGPAARGGGAGGPSGTAGAVGWSEPDSAVGVSAADTLRRGPFRGNARSRVFHSPSCQHYTCPNCTVELGSVEAAREAGFRPHGDCVLEVHGAP